MPSAVRTRAPSLGEQQLRQLQLATLEEERGRKQPEKVELLLVVVS